METIHKRWRLMKTYEITLYNKEVRKLVEQGDSHPQYDDGWADQRFIQLQAENEERARRLIHARHPARKGFVIIDILELPDFV